MASRKEPKQPRPERNPGDFQFETQIRARALLAEILARTPQDDARLELLELLDYQLQVDEHQLEEARQAIAQFEEVYQKLTSPANRIGTYLGSPTDGIAYIAVGDAEYYANVDPKLNLKTIKVGTRIKVNEAFTVIGDLGYHPEGPIVKVSEILPDGRLRVSVDGHQLSGRILLRSSDLEKTALKPGDEVRLEPSLRVALEHFQKSEVRGYYLEQIPDISWEQVGGQEEAIQLIRDTIERPLLYPDLYKRFGKRQLKGILLYGPPGCGKCVAGDTPILLADGRVEPIDKLFEESRLAGTTLKDDGGESIIEPNSLEVLTLDPDSLQIVPKKVDFVYRERYQGDLYEVTTHSGRKITVTPEHPFLVLNQGINKVRVADIKLGDFIAVPRRIRTKHEEFHVPSKATAGFAVEGNGTLRWISPYHPRTRPVKFFQDVNGDLAECFGFLLSEGSRSAGGLNFHNSDLRLIERVATLSRETFGLEPMIKPDTSDKVYKVMMNSVSLLRWLKQAFDFDLVNSRATDVPDSLMRSPQSIVARFLRAVFESEATVRKDVPEIELTTASPKFASKLTYLLLRFGIAARIREKRVRTNDHTYYRLYISGASHLRTFQKQIGFFSDEKNRRLEKWTAPDRKEITNVDILPNIQDLLSRARTEVRQNKEQFYQTKHNYEGRKILSRRKLGEILEAKPDTATIAVLSRLCQSDILWDRVVSITKKRADGYVYDLTVADTHTFIGGLGGIITHNTLIAKATAYNLTQSYKERLGQDVREYFMFINGPQLLNMWLGETERMVREIFSLARERAKEGHLVFVFIDEADSLLRVRSSGRYLNIANTVVPQFAAEMDGLVDLENVVVMLTSNRPDYIDPAILRPERIDRKVKIGRPDRRASADILRIYLNERVPLDPTWVKEHDDNPDKARSALIEQAADYLFRRSPETAFLEVHLRSGRRETLYWSDLVSGALLMSAVERAKDFAIQRCIGRKNANEGIRLEDLQEALRAEYHENEIFPKTDYLEDWLKLIDFEAEDVMEVRPIREGDRRFPIESVV